MKKTICSYSAWKLSVLVFLSFSFFYSISQNRKIDSLQTLLLTSKEDTNKVKLLVVIGRNFGQIGEYDTCIEYSQQSLALAEKLNYKYGEASSLTNIALCYKEKGNYPLSLDYNLKGLKIREEMGNKKDIAASLNNIAIIFKDMKDYEKSIEYNLRSLKIKESISDSFGIAASLNNIAVVYRLQNREKEALDYNLKALEIRKIINDRRGVATSLNNIGNSMLVQKEFEKANDYLMQSLKIREEIEDNPGIVLSLAGISNTYREMNNLKEAEKYALKGLVLAKQFGLVYELKEILSALSKVFEKQKKFEEAHFYYKAYVSLRDSIFNDENSKATIRMEMNYEFDKKKAAEKLEQEKKEAVAIAESKKQKIIIISICGILLLVIAFAVFAYRSFLQKQKAAVEITIQKEVIEEKQKEILDSINYAKRIQSAILANEEDIKVHFPESFLLYIPKDIIAGDFYFFESTKQHVFYAAADCTGHGVPGAMISVVCANALSRCVNEFELTEPGEILDKARELVLNTFKKSGQDVKDGMDISLFVKGIKTNSYKWAGANNPLWILQQNKLTEITANKQSIGLIEKPQPFTTHTLQLDKGDTVFLFTDGYADQFGGPQGKKFKYKQFGNTLEQIAKLPLPQQKEKLQIAFNIWKGQQEQVDDVCVIGIKI